MTQRGGQRRQRPPDEGGVGGGTAPDAVGLEWVLAFATGIVMIIVVLVIADIIQGS